MKLAIGSDVSGFPLKDYIVKHLHDNHREIELLDFGIESPDYPKMFYDQAGKVSLAIQNSEAQMGILICGTGQGMCIAANKYKGIYAAHVTDILCAERVKAINNVNIITLGCWVTAPVMAAQVVDRWLSVSFTENMDSKRDYIIEAFHKVQEMEANQFK